MASGARRRVDQGGDAGQHTTNRRNFFMVASPDGGSFAFLSLQGYILTLYRQSLTPGSDPVQVADIKPPPAMGDAAPQDLMPVLLAWQ
ncbi:hypothetical protein [Streptomyces sp. NPDC048385]|uniref:hypothetical protein n=1 Tax=Streptomyces sp. NPDC048385 TaxID=3155145 RepID=UPI00342810E1